MPAREAAAPQTGVARLATWPGRDKAPAQALLVVPWRPAYLAIATRGGEPVGVGVCNERKYLVSRSADPGAAALLAQDAARNLATLPGWMGPLPEIRDFNAARGHAGQLAMTMRIYVLDTAPVLPAVSGRCRPATSSDADLLTAWHGAFGAEARTGAREQGGDRARIDEAIAEGALRVWEDAGRVVSMAKSAPGAPDSARVSLVYTPPESRRRGYASACVAALSTELLRAGRRYCYLYADLANPVSNSIYRRVGYRAVADVEDWRPTETPS